MGKVLRNGCVSMFLNRVCHRKCPYCNVVDRKLEKKRLSIEDWKLAFRILEVKGAKFFLCIGTEPLLMGDDLLELVKLWKRRNYEYGIYTTAPKDLVGKMLPLLISSGLRNWSSGVDFVPEVFENVRCDLTKECLNLVESEKEGLVSKAIDGIEGMRLARDSRIKELHISITISRMNIEMVPEIISWLVKDLGVKLHIAYNYIEVGKRTLDFASSESRCLDYIFKEEDEEVFRSFIKKMVSLPKSDLLRIQSPIEYLDNWDKVLNLNLKADGYSCSLCVECDGTLRKCAYGKGKYVSQFTVFDLDSREYDIKEAWERDLSECLGCYWSLPFLVGREGVDAVDYRSEYWRSRDKFWRGNVRNSGSV